MARSKTNTDRLKKYQQDITLVQDWRKQQGYDAMWLRLIDLYRGKHFSEVYMNNEDRIAVNIAFSTINVIFPAISVSMPKISVLANAPENEDRSVIAGAILNYWWKHYDMQSPFRSASKDFLIVGHGWVKVGWRTLEGQRLMTSAEYDSAFMKKADERDTYLAENPENEHMVPSYEEIAESITETKTVVKEDRPFMERVSPFDIYVDPDATCMQDARWITQRIIRPLEEVRADKRYKQSARLAAQGSAMVAAQHLIERERRRAGDDILRVAIWEHYDLISGKMCVFTEGGSDFLVEPMDMPYSVGHPFVMVRNYDVPGHFYPIGDLEMLEPLQMELNATRSALLNNRKSYARKYFYRKSGFGEDGIAALRSDADNTMVPVDDDRPFGDLFAPMPQSNMTADMYNLSDIISADAREVSGVSEYQRGISPSVRRTATEAAMIQDATNARSADKLGIIEGFVTAIVRMQLQVAQQFLSGDQVARVLGREGKNLWFPYTRDDILGEYDFSVEAGSTQPGNDQQRRQDALGLVQAATPFMEMGIADPIQLYKHVLQQGFKIRGFEKFISADALKKLEMQTQMLEQQLQQQTMQNQQMAVEGGTNIPNDPTQQGQFGVQAPQMAPQDLLMAQQGDTAMSGAV